MATKPAIRPPNPKRHNRPDELFENMDGTLTDLQDTRRTTWRGPNNADITLQVPNSQDEGVWRCKLLIWCELHNIQIVLQLPTMVIDDMRRWNLQMMHEIKRITFQNNSVSTDVVDIFLLIYWLYFWYWQICDIPDKWLKLKFKRSFSFMTIFVSLISISFSRSSKDMFAEWDNSFIEAVCWFFKRAISTDVHDQYYKSWYAGFKHTYSDNPFKVMILQIRISIELILLYH